MSNKENYQTNNQIPAIRLLMHQNHDRGCILTFQGDAGLLNEPELHVHIVRDHKEQESGSPDQGRVFPVFRQNAGNYGIYSDYIDHHGCACCSLTTLLAAYCPACRDYRPEDTIDLAERSHFPEEVWEENYSKPLRRQMPVTLYGISRILESEGVSNQYIGAFRDREAVADIKAHLKRGLPVVIETSRIRRKNGLPVSFHDRKYAGSYHTMILLGFDPKGYVVFTDSATRQWAGDVQRLKRDRLSNLVRYMFPQRNPAAHNLYFDHRFNTGGYILINEA